jgi:CheY-like chemotaxis protein
MSGKSCILIADDSPVMQEYFTVAFEEFAIDIVRDGEELLFKAMKQPYKLILVDLTMPVLSGSDAVRRLRRDPGPNQRTAIYAITGDLYESVTEDAKSAGFDFVFSKPDLTYDRIHKLFTWAS